MKPAKIRRLEEIYDNLSALLSHLYESENLFIPGRGNPDTSILFVGDSPHKRETIKKDLFQGNMIKYVEEIVQPAGLKKEDIFFTNVCKRRTCRINKNGVIVNRPPNREELGLCLPFLKKEIATIEPKLVISFGIYAFRMLSADTSPLSEIHAKEQAVGVNGHSFTLFPLFHPLSVSFNKALRAAYHEDIEKLIKLIILT